MLRIAFVLLILAIGFRYSFKHPFYVLLFYLWMAYFRPEQWLWWDFLSQFRLSTVLGVWLLVSTVFSGERFRLGTGPLLLFAFMLQCVISTGLSPASAAAWPYVIEFGKVVAIGYMMTVLITTEERLRQALIVIAMSLGFEGAKQGLTELIIHPGSQNLNSWPMLGDNNGVAVGMLMLTSILLCLVATEKGKYTRRVFQVMALGTLYRALSTYSRGGFVAAAVLGLHHLARSSKRGRAILAIVVACAIIAPALPDAFWDRMATIGPSVAREGDEDDSVRSRLHFWSVATSMAQDRPFFGVGQNAFNEMYDRYDSSFGLYGIGRSVHSSWFGILAELGIPGLFLFVALFLGAFGTTIRVRRAARTEPRLANLAAYGNAIEAGLLVMVVGGAFVPFQYNEMVWHFLALSMVVGRLAKPQMAELAAPEMRISRPVGQSPAPTLARVGARPLR